MQFNTRVLLFSTIILRTGTSAANVDCQAEFQAV